jgi:hypothetical protein
LQADESKQRIEQDDVSIAQRHHDVSIAQRVVCPACACEQVRNRNSEEYNVLKIQLEGIIEELERHFEQVRHPLVDTLGC